MPVERSVVAYKQEKLNCAQSILRGFQLEKNVSEEYVVAARKDGGGRAEGGRCGALHAAITLVDCPDKRAELSQRFVSYAGSEQCREIRRSKSVSCEQCVRHAAQLLAEMR